MKGRNKMCAAALFFMMTGGLVLAADTTKAEPVQAVAAATQAKAKTAQAAPVQQTYSLDLDTTKYEKKTMTVDGKKVAFRAYENRVYVARPVDTTYQSMNIYVPEGYFKGKTINGYTAKTAPIFLPNTVGGYMPGAPGQPSENDRMTGGANAMLVALSKGYVVAAPGARGRTNQAADGTYTGKAPALIVDMKAAVRYLRHNAGKLPGDTEKIISNGTSAGGALSTLIGATGDSRDYEPYLKALGAADERDDIYASSVYCPITDLDHADMAYEWMFNGVNTYHQGNMGGMMPPPAGKGQAKPAGVVINRPDNAPTEAASGTEMTAVQQQASKDLKAMYPAYINSLHLVDKNGNALTLDANGKGSFANYIKAIYMASAQKALDNGTDLSSKTWLTIKDGKVTDMDLAGYAADVTRLKAAPAFDGLDLSTGENQEFGTATIDKQHFTEYGETHSLTAGATLADKGIVKLLNPLNYIGKSGVKTAQYWRIRHGEADRDTTIAVPAVLAARLQQAGYTVDFASPWARGHAGDYDLDELFAWMDFIGHKN
ncbi:MAG: subtype B tannase [Megasphaera sp.]|uniref:subtype B tannase n=1 Tax=Megasphaera sp. TaxID=2023260 RepID=UPI003F051AD9